MKWIPVQCFHSDFHIEVRRLSSMGAPGPPAAADPPNGTQIPEQDDLSDLAVRTVKHIELL